MTTKVFLQTMPEAYGEEEGNRNESSTILQITVSQVGILVRPSDGKDKVFVLVSCHPEITCALQVPLEVLIQNTC